MRYKPVHKYRFYQNSWGGWIYKSFFFHTIVVENAGGRDSRHWQWGSVIFKKIDRNRTNSKYHCYPFGSHQFKRIRGFWKDFHGTLFRVPTQQTLSSSIDRYIHLNLSKKSNKHWDLLKTVHICYTYVSPINCHFAIKHFQLSNAYNRNFIKYQIPMYKL